MTGERTPARRGSSRRLAGTAGSVAVEAGLILPLLILLLIPVLDLGLAAYDSLQVAAAAEAGAQYASTHSWDAAAIADAVAGATGSSTITASPAPSQFCACVSQSNALQPAGCGTICADGSTPGTYARIDAQTTLTTVLHYPALPNPLTLSGEAIRRIK